jgi:D-alanyl-D-alanine dipeptidase
MPRFDEPTFTRAATEVLAGVTVPERPPLPPLADPDKPLVLHPVDEPLVPVDHPRIRPLGNYWHAGWQRSVPGCWLRAGAFTRLCRVADALPERWGLAVFDAWRPLALQAELYHAAYDHPGLPEGFVSPPDDDPRTPPPHLTGGTVDLTLTFDGAPLAPGAGFDDFTPRARADAVEHEPGIDRAVRRLLYWGMREEGFVVLDCEWWHFEHGTRRWAAISGETPRYGPARLPELVGGNRATEPTTA